MEAFVQIYSRRHHLLKGINLPRLYIQPPINLRHMTCSLATLEKNYAPFAQRGEQPSVPLDRSPHPSAIV